MSIQEKTQIVGSTTQAASSKLDQEILVSSHLLQHDKNSLKPDRRSRIETHFDVLCVVGNGVDKPTHIMYKANLSWSIMQMYIDALIQKNLIIAEMADVKKRYRVSEKGRHVMQQYLSIREDLDMISETNR